MDKHNPLFEEFLLELVEKYNHVDFIQNDPIQIPHLFSKKQDIEIAGYFAATFAWGQRKTIIAKCKDLLNRMDNEPFEFIKNYSSGDEKVLTGFKHRTFNDIDLNFIIQSLHQFYAENESLESLYCTTETYQFETSFEAIKSFSECFLLNPEMPNRTKRHISSPVSGSACKRLNMFLRWMVRKDTKGVDFGIWSKINPSQLIMPLDVHTARMAREWKLLPEGKNDWKTALNLTNELKKFSVTDPVQFDFALFGYGVEEKRMLN